jgi:DNA (cytosine-5)-methyltransferase 1
MPIILPSSLHELALFAGAGGGILGGKLLGWRTVCAVEWDAYARDVLVARQNDGCLETFPIWDDVQTFDGTPWRGAVDVVSGGFPCQDISSAGKGAGIDGERSGMWKQMARICGEIRPCFILVENSPMLVGRGLAVVLGDLAEMGYDAEWGIVGAHHASAPHKRERIWIVATDATLDAGKQRRAECAGLQRPTGLANGRDDMADAYGINGDDGRHGASPIRRQQGRESSELSGGEGIIRHAAGAGLPHGTTKPMGEPGADAQSERSDWWATEPNVGRVAHGVAARVDRLRCIGNGQVSRVVPLAWNLLKPKK